MLKRLKRIELPLLDTCLRAVEVPRLLKAAGGCLLKLTDVEKMRNDSLHFAHAAVLLPHFLCCELPAERVN